MRKTRSWLLLLMLFVQHVSFGQLTMTIQVPPVGVLQKSQLWNIALVNGSDNTVNAQINLTLLSNADNRAVMTASTNLIVIPKGAKLLKFDDVAPVQYNYLSPSFNVDLSPTGLLPVGNYTACYSVFTPKNDIVVEDCVPLEVQPLSPPMLNMPEDGAQITSKYPSFSWIPPAPMNLFNQLTYDFILVKMQEGQSPAQAIQQNLPEYNTGFIRNNFQNFPASYKALDTGVHYAWGVVARNNGEFAAQSDAWSFSLASGAIQSVQDNQVFTTLKSAEDGSSVLCRDKLKFEYINDANDSLVTWKIISLDADIQKEIAKNDLFIDPGSNLIELPLASLRLDADRTYQFRLLNSRNEIWSVKFIYSPLSKAEE